MKFQHIALICLIFGSTTNLQYAEDQVITCTVHPDLGDSSPFVRDTALALVLCLKNVSEKPFSVYTARPAYLFSASGQMADGTPLTPIPEDKYKAKPLTTEVRPGKTYERKLYLNNYVSFPTDGKFQISWKVTVSLIDGLEAQAHEFEGAFRGSIHSASNDVVSQEMNKLLSFFLTSEDQVTRRDILEGIASVRTESTLKLLEQCMFAPGSSTFTMLALVNRWDSKERNRVLDKFMLTSNDDQALNVAMQSVILERRLLPDDVIQRLLQSERPPVFHCGVTYLKAVLPMLRLDLLNNESAKDDVHKRSSNQILEMLRNVLKNNPGSLDKEKANANGF